MATHDRSQRAVSYLVVCIFFVVVLIVGFQIYDDYGVNVDEAIQRKHAIVNYYFIQHNVFGRDMSELRESDDYQLREDGTKQDLWDYRSRSYGVALQLPTVWIEDINNFQMTSQEVFQMRHLYNFLIYFSGLVALFFLLRDLLKNVWVALAGTAMFYLFPHFFASSYYNVKDLLFIPMFIISCFFMVRMLTRGRQLSYCLLFIVFSALASNIRILGIMPVAAAVVCMLVEDVIRKKATNGDIQAELSLPGRQPWWWRVLPYLLCIVGFGCVWLLLAPAAWINPLDYIKQTVGKAIEFDLWTNNAMIFQGQVIGKEDVPWFYLPVWMGITIPLFYVILFFVGAAFLLGSLFPRGRAQRFVENRVMWVFFLLFLVPLLAQMLLGITIYLGWRHMYVLMVPLIVLASYGLLRLQQVLSKHKAAAGRAVIPIVTSVALVTGTVRVAVNHPYQHSMFNSLGVSVANQFDRDYYRMSAKQCIEWLLREFPGQKLAISSDVQLITPAKSFTPNQQALIDLRSQEQGMEMFFPAEFYIELFRYHTGNESPMAQKGYTEIHAIWVDGYKIASVLRNDLVKEYDETGIFRMPIWYFKTWAGVGKLNPERTAYTSTGKGGFLLYGPYYPFEKGKYTVRAKIKLINSGGNDEIATGDVYTAESGHAVVMTERKLSKEDFDVNGEYELTLAYTLGNPLNQLEFRMQVPDGVILEVSDIVFYRK